MAAGSEMPMSSALPDSIAEIARRTATPDYSFDVAVREFLDCWQTMDEVVKLRAIAEEPRQTGKVEDAYLGALAEHLAQLDRLPAPEWSAQSQRFLATPFFAGGLHSLKATLIVESPAAFRRRLIFISANALSRPRRIFTQDNALNVSNLDV
jgi:hypothetical protein